MSIIFSKAIESAQASKTLAVAQKAAEMIANKLPVWDLSVGEPDSDTPQNIKDTAIKAIQEGKTKYTPVPGVLDLRKAIKEKFKRENSLEFELDQVVVGCGAKQIIHSAFFVTLNDGDEVLIFAPYWTSYPEMVRLCGGNPVIIRDGNIDNNFKISPEKLRQSLGAKTKWIILNSPSNPNGSVYKPDELENIAAVLKDFPHVLILSDDIYEHIIFDNVKFTNILNVAPELQNRVFVVNGVSKAYSMTGWRFGYGAGPALLCKNINKFQSNTTTHPTSISQYAAIQALNEGYDFAIRQSQTFQKRRDFVASLLNKIPGLRFSHPEGAFYFYVSCEEFIGKLTSESKIIIKDDTEFATQLLLAEGVAVVPGAAFGLSPYFRMSFATSNTILENAIKKIGNFCDSLSH